MVDTVIEPKVRGFICVTAHPTGCFEEVLAQIEYVKAQGKIKTPKKLNVLVIGSSTGYGLASRILAAFGTNANTIGVFFEKPADDKRTASPGWYNMAAFEKIAHAENLYAKSINGDAFSEEIKRQTADLIKRDLGQVDLVIYSLASPRRLDPKTGEIFSSVLKPIGQTFTSKTVDAFKQEVNEVSIPPAVGEEIENTIKVMGGEDWEWWIQYLAKENLLAPGIKTIAYSYIGPELTHAIYKEGSIGKAKEHLYNTAKQLNQQLAPLQGSAFISVNKALVTQASAAIPVVPLYIALLFKIMKEKGTHEGCIEQIYRLFKNYLYADAPQVETLIRLDDLEMQEEVQSQISTLWSQVNSDNIKALSDINGYCQDFYRLFGFSNPKVDYNKPVNPRVDIESINT